jgi:septin family protein
LGKTTFINTLCGSKVIPRRSFEDPSLCSVEKTLQITPYSVGLYALLLAGTSVPI